MDIELPQARAVSPVGAKIFTPDQVAFATFLSGPLGGGVLLALSHRRAGTGRALMPLGVGLVLTAASVAAAVLLGSHMTFVVPLAGVFAMRGLAQQQEASLAASAGAFVRASNLATFGIALAMLVATVVIAGGAYVAYEFSVEPDAVEFGNDQEVQYATSTTADDARVVGGVLQDEGVFSATTGGKTVRIARDHGDLDVKFVMRKGSWDEPAIIEWGKQMRNELAPRFASDRVVVELCDDEFDPQRKIDASDSRAVE